MKLKPLYMYGVIFVIIIAAIVITSSKNSKESAVVSNPSLNSEMPNDATHQGMGKMPNDATHQGMGKMPADAVHQGMGKVNDDAPSKDNVREDFWTKMEKFKADIKANPSDTAAMKNYAQMLGMSHQTEEAIKLYKKILAIDPNRIDVLLAEGLAYYTDQNYKMAEAVTKKIIAIDSNNLEAKYNVGVIAASIGDNERAKRIWKELADKYPNKEIGKLAANSLIEIDKK